MKVGEVAVALMRDDIKITPLHLGQVLSFREMIALQKFESLEVLGIGW